MVRNYTFADNFWESPKKNGVTALMERMRGAKQTCERLKHAYEARASLEEQYGRELLKIAEKQKPSSMETGSSNQTMLLMQSEFQSIADSHLQLAKLLQDQVATPLSKLLNKQHVLRKEFQSTINKLSSRRKIQIQFVKTAIKRHSVEVAKANALVQQQTSENEKMAVHKMSEPAIMNLQNVYNEAMKDLSAIIEEWNIEWKKACQNFEKLEQERLELIKNNISNYTNLIVGCLEGEIKACERVNDAAMAIDVDHDLDNFILEQKSSDVIPSPQDYLKLTSLYESTKRHSNHHHDTVISKEDNKGSKHIENLMDTFINHRNERNVNNTEIQDESNEKTKEVVAKEKEETGEPDMVVYRMEVYGSDSDEEEEEEEENEYELEEGENEEYTEEQMLFEKRNGNDNHILNDRPPTLGHQAYQQPSKITEKPKQVSFVKQGSTNGTLFSIKQEEEDDDTEVRPVFHSQSPPPPLSTSPKEGDEEDSDEITEEFENEQPLNSHSFSEPVLVKGVLEEGSDDDDIEEGRESALAYEELIQEINSKDSIGNVFPDIRPTTSISTPLQDMHYKRRSVGYDKDNMNYHDITRRRLSSIDVNNSIRMNNNQGRPYHNSYYNSSQRFKDTIGGGRNNYQNELTKDQSLYDSFSTSSDMSSQYSQRHQNTHPSAQIMRDRILRDNSNTEPSDSRQRRRQSRQYQASDALSSPPTSSLSSYPSTSSNSSGYGDTYNSQRMNYNSRDYHSKRNLSSDEKEEEEEEEEEDIEYIDFAIAAHDYQSTEEDEITFKRNDLFGIVSKSETGWWGACLLDRRTNKVIQSGIIPSTYTTDIKDSKIALKQKMNRKTN